MNKNVHQDTESTGTHLISQIIIKTKDGGNLEVIRLLKVELFIWQVPGPDVRLK